METCLDFIVPIAKMLILAGTEVKGRAEQKEEGDLSLAFGGGVNLRGHCKINFVLRAGFEP